MKTVFETFLKSSLGKACTRNSLDRGGFALKEED